MAVLPPRSAHALPKPYQELMTDSRSSIIEFYPTDFEIDVDGKRFMWQGICKLPFINQEVLLSATKPLEEKLEESEASRNIQGSNQLLTRGSNRADRKIWSYLQQQAETKELGIQPAEGENEILCSNFELPIASVHIPRLLEGVQLPDKMIFENDIMETPLWHEYAGNRPPMSRFPAQDRYRRFANDSKKERWTQETSTPRCRGWFREPTFDCKKDGTMRDTSAQSHKNMRSTQEASIYKYPGPGRGFDQAGRGRGTSCSVSEPRYNNVNRWDKKTIGYQQSSMSSTSSGGYHHNTSPSVSYGNAVVTGPYISRGMQNMRLSPFEASGLDRGRDHNAQNSFWPSRSSRVSHESPSWRPASHAKPTSEGGNMQQFTGRGRGRAQIRPN